MSHLKMPPMAMVFRVAEAKMLDDLRAGDKIQFLAVRVQGALTIDSYRKTQ
jgi:Cu(I)/Ag(I) efflux system protein CusF